MTFKIEEGVGNTYRKAIGMKTNVTETSLDAYSNIKDNLGKKQAKVYEAIKTMVQATDAELAFFLHQPINTVTPRRNELMHMGVIILAEKRECSVTRNTAQAWRIAP